MAISIQQGEEKFHQCQACGYQHEEKEWAEKCEAWCKEYHRCNLDIIKHGVPPKQ